MRTGSQNWRRCLWSIAQAVGLLTVFYCYVLWRVRPELFYQQKPDVFLFDSYFAATYLERPGGPVEYASAFLSPLFAFAWLGALTLTLLAAYICLATRQLLAALAAPRKPESPAGGDNPAQVVFLIPALLILMVMGRYNHPVSLGVGLCMVLGLTGVYVRIGHGQWARRLRLCSDRGGPESQPPLCAAGGWVRFAAFLILSALAYYAAAGLYVVFALLCGIFEWRIRHHRWLGAWCVLSAVVVPMVAGVWLWDLSRQEAYRGILLPTERYWLAVPSSALVSLAIRGVLLLFFPVAALWAAWCRRPAGSPVACPEASPRRCFAGAWLSRAAVYGPGGTCYGLRPALQWAVLIVLGIAADVLLFDVSTKDSLLVAYSAERQQWADVLTSARRLPPSDAWNVFQVNRALYHRGELLERMFAHPQVADAVPTLTLQFPSLTVTAQRAPLECGDILFDLGRINESEHMAYEALELFGERPHTLQRLVYLHAIQGEPDAARRFLAVLERSPWHRRWAQDLLRQLDADPTLASDPVIASRRALMVERDFTGKLDLETMLGQLLERNPRNRMACEYLMAYYLLTRQVDKMVANLHRFDVFDQARLPRYCEEAILIHLDTVGPQAIDLRGRQIHPETRRRGGEFVQAVGRWEGNPSAAFAALHHDFGDSYFFFYVFGYNDFRLAPARPSR